MPCRRWWSGADAPSSSTSRAATTAAASGAPSSGPPPASTGPRGSPLRVPRSGTWTCWPRRWNGSGRRLDRGAHRSSRLDLEHRRPRSRDAPVTRRGPAGPGDRDGAWAADRRSAPGAGPRRYGRGLLRDRPERERGGRRLHLSPRTVTYRLQRVAELLDRRWTGRKCPGSPSRYSRTDCRTSGDRTSEPEDRLPPGGYGSLRPVAPT